MKEMKKYCLADFANLLSEKGLLTDSDLKDKGNTFIEGLTYNSKEAVASSLFVCKGKNFKEEYLREAIEKGALCYVSEEKYSPDIPYITVSNVRTAMRELADFYYCRPYEDMKMIGITGTKGKTTATFFIKAIIDDYMAATGGKESGYMSSSRQYDGAGREPVYLTTPEAIDLMRHLRNAADSGIEYFTLEASSQGLKYDRVGNVHFHVAAFTNIMEDHISPNEHPDFSDYLNSKLKIFAQSDIACVNLNTDELPKVLEAAGKTQRLITYGTTDEADIYAYNIRKENGKIHFNVKCDRFDRDFELSMLGFHNVENALAAIAVCYVLDIPDEYMYSGMKETQPPCRMEQHPSKDGKVNIIVDFAHNKLSFLKVFEAVKEEFPTHKIYAVFGCGGGKAYSRRKAMGTIAGQNSDRIYLTMENPGPERFEDITAEIAKAVETQGCPYEIIQDRGEALSKAVSDVTEPTIILIMGCGEMKYQRIGSQLVSRPSDVEYANECIAKYNETH